MKIKVKDGNLVENLSLYQKNLINNNVAIDEDEIERHVSSSSMQKTMETMENPFKGTFGKVFEMMTPKELREDIKEAEELRYKEEKEQTEMLLDEAIRRTRYEMGGLSLEETAKVIMLNLSQEESRILIDNLVSLQGLKYGERLFE